GGAHTQTSRDRGPSLVEGVTGALAHRVVRRGVAELAGQVRPHCLEHLTAYRGGGSVVEVDHANRMSSPRSSARTLCVSAPTEMRSTPVFAMSATVSRVTPP